MMSNYLLCCDWGTTSFRLRLTDMTNREIIGEITAGQGIAATSLEWSLVSAGGSVTRENFYRKELSRQITNLSVNLALDLDGIPIAMSGMGSSSLGMVELPYAFLPFSLAGQQAVVSIVEAADWFLHDIFLISGITNGLDVMRGEETQLLGVWELMETVRQAAGETIFIFPGTHSKHIYVQAGQVTGFKTYMTGEIFSLMVSTSILRESVEFPSAHAADMKAFAEGVKYAGAENLLHTLFSVRGNQLFERRNKRENFYYLSGLIIGAELKELVSEIRQIVLCCDEKLYEFYKSALKELSIPAVLADPSMMDRAVVAGQIKIFQNQICGILPDQV
ncbi:putative 2-dehydro-3-deoxygalactonokinase DgoK1 [Dyadobacter sp. CECT 9275]|uniref:2-dehydro-3-deoxygalactonokinase DgoK1 n=1 Tax=Dyadobacter helix TaxID=2822344 RepID=A0A916J8N1_9BACT|nr:2-dehydro-3-deoxygalactonokinase [Dyadobacter sp. CECT 9275]CAG4988311.1 putative 2-dehydro-3-deoxygalactonokinase DgoK1 [Dyadobacter sp. CECT 9275]